MQHSRLKKCYFIQCYDVTSQSVTSLPVSFCVTSRKAEDFRELEASMETTERQSGSSFR